MQIKINQNASQHYLGTTDPVNWGWYRKLQLLDGQILEVETDFLFTDQFNTAPYKGEFNKVEEKGRWVYEELANARNSLRLGTGLRIMANLVERVIGDERPGKARCQWCGVTSTSQTNCDKCGKDDYLTPFTQDNLQPKF